MTPVSAETDLTADDDAGRRGARRLPLLGAFLAGALLLSACGGSPEEEGQAGSEEPSASASAIESADGGSDEEAPSSDGSSQGSSSESSGGSADEGDSDGSGEPVPASSDGPAQNWPEPEAPGEISEKSEEGAEAALEYWWELYAYARNTGDTSPLANMSMSTCDYCKDRVEHTLGIYDQGDWWRQDEYGIGEVALVHQEDGSYKGFFVMDEGSFISYYEDSPPESNEGTEGQLWGAKFVYAEGRWVAEDLTHQCNRGQDQSCSAS